jgi:hypothetical protein
MNALINPSDTLSLFQTNKGQRMDFVMTLVDQITNGVADPLTAHLQVKCLEDLLDLIKENTIYKHAVLEAAEQHGTKSFEFHNATFKFMEVGVKYDYSKCEDPVILDLMEQEKSIKDKLKVRQKLLQAMPVSGMADPETGSLVYPPSRSSSTTIAVTLK